jgi:RNA polymerase sigma-70 factor (ECF subfamily)
MVAGLTGGVARSLARMDALTQRLRRFVRARVANRHDAEDVIQEAYLRVLRYSAEHEIGNREHLLFSAARNLAVDNQRRKKARERSVAECAVFADRAGEWPPADDVVDVLQRLTSVEAAIDLLPPRCREVFLMHRLDGMSYSEISRQLGISVSAVEKHVARACLLIDAKVNDEHQR